MKIVIDATPVAHGHRAIRRHSKNLIEALLRQRKNHQYRLLYINPHRRRNRYTTLQVNRLAKECIVPVPGRLLVPLWRYVGLPRMEWLVGHFDVFYSTDLYFPPSRIGVTLGSVRGIAYHIIEEKLDPNVVIILKKGLAFTLMHSDYLLAVSETTRKDLIERLAVPKDRIYVVQHGVDPCFRRVEDRAALWQRLNAMLGLSDPYILYVGVIGHHKNIIGLLQAHKLILNRGMEIPLVLAGPPGSAWDSARQWIAEKGIGDWVHMIGPVDHEGDELVDLYNGAALFVFPSFYEGWTAPPLEAMACGTPVITSNCSSLPEAVGDAAVQVDPENIESMAFEIERILSDTVMQTTLIEKGFRHIAQHTWDGAAEKFVAVLEDIHSRGPWKGKKY